ncbi:AMP-binding protein [Coxiella-like endosymbiont]|uniref:AMP-binding protein n=1 Tax=Coxiella-like endosymbiont TaxID=1592897 RepID=UPI00272D1B4E|nr:AMP-binding protein [Coxiella-like endosymbiont]
MKKQAQLVIEGYDLTEVSPVVIINLSFNDSIGFPVPNTDVSIWNDTNKAVSLDEEGDFCVRGPQVMKGYWKESDETEKVIHKEG